ncbi:MAG: O-antigen ligase family protein [Thiobacillaceae bacterium]
MKSLLLPTSWAPAILAWSFLLLLPFGRSSELPFLIMAILGGMLIWRHGKQATWQGGAKTFSLLFLCIWIPIALSVPDSLWFSKSLSTALTYPRIYFAGIYLIWMLHENLVQQRLLKLSAWLMLFWVGDALIQVVIGYDLLGYAYPERLNGLFGTHDWKLGLTLAMLSPIAWEYVSHHGAKWQLALAWIGTAAVVLLASNRESWIMFALATLLWGWVYAQRLGFHPAKLLAPLALIAVVSGIGAYQHNPKFAQRMDQSMAALDFTYAGLDKASSFRVHVWSNAVAVLEDHQVNGAGVRAYRYAYARYAEKNDPYVNPDGTGMIYAHQLLLEVGSETGGIGLAGLLAFFVIFIRTGRGLSTQPLAWAAWLGAFAWLFPLNTHTALYSAYWSLMIGWLLAIASAGNLATDTSDQSLILRPPSTAST